MLYILISLYIDIISICMYHTVQMSIKVLRTSYSLVDKVDYSNALLWNYEYINKIMEA